MNILKIFPKKMIVLIVLGVIVLIITISFVLNADKRKAVSLSYDGKPFVVHDFGEFYEEGIRYITVLGSVDGVDGEYIFDLSNESILPLEGNELLLDENNSTCRYTISVGNSNLQVPYIYEYQNIQIPEIRDYNLNKSVFVSFSDNLGVYKDLQLDISKLYGFTDAEFINFYGSKTGRYIEIQMSIALPEYEALKQTIAVHLIDMLTQAMVDLPKDFDCNNKYELIRDDEIFVYALADDVLDKGSWKEEVYRRAWHMTENAYVDLLWQPEFINDFGSFSQNGEYLYWNNHYIYACNTYTGEATKIVDFDNIKSALKSKYIGVMRDGNDIKWISENEIGLIVYEAHLIFGVYPLPIMNYYIVKYNTDTHLIESVKLLWYDGKGDEHFAWSYDKSELYHINKVMKKMYKAKI